MRADEERRQSSSPPRAHTLQGLKWTRGRWAVGCAGCSIANMQYCEISGYSTVTQSILSSTCIACAIFSYLLYSN